VELGPVIVDAPAAVDALWVTDGQQRLTSLIGVLLAPEDVRGAFELYFDLGTETFRRPGSRRPSADWLPLRHVLDTSALLNWLLTFKGQGGSEKAVAVATVLGERIREYKVPVSIVRTDDEAVLRDIFDRLNNFGRRLTRAEVFRALHAAIGDHEPNDLRDLVDEVAGLEFGLLREDTILRSVLAVRGGDVFRDFRNEFSQGEDPSEAYRQTADALRAAVMFLQGDARIPHARVLPYALVVPVLARFFALFPNPTHRSRVLLRRWVWRGAMAGVGGGAGATAVLRRAVQAVTGNEIDSVQRLMGLVAAPAQPSIDVTATQLNRAAARANVALLASLGPRDFSTGELLDTSAVLGAEDAGLLRLTGPSNRVESLASVFVHPPLPEEDAAVALGGAPSEVLRSHSVTEEAARALREGAIDIFLRLRRSELAVVLGSAELVLAEPGLTDRPPLSSLVVSE
jgi:hypothetical protein